MQVSISEAARILGLPEKTVRRRVRGGELPGTQTATPQGYRWTVEVPDEVPDQEKEVGEQGEHGSMMRELLDTFKEEVATLKDELARKNTQIEQLHVLLQQQAVALPAPRENRSLWRFWRW